MVKNEGFTSFFKGLVPKVHPFTFLVVMAMLTSHAATHDWPQARIFVLACADLDPSIRYGFQEMSFYLDRTCVYRFRDARGIPGHGNGVGR